MKGERSKGVMEGGRSKGVMVKDEGRRKE